MYAVEDDLIFTACHYDDSWQKTGEFYSEVELLKLEEVRLLSSILLPIHFERGLVLFHPMPHEVLIPDRPSLDAVEAATVMGRELKAALTAKAHEIDEYLSLPRVFGGQKTYDFRQMSLPIALQEQLFRSIDINDYLLVRGLYALIRSSMLLSYPMFLEEAALALYVSLDASFSLVIRHLTRQGKVNPSAHDAGAWLAATFKEDYFDTKYFEEYYDDRIKAMHPASRFGIFPFAPLTVDDCYYLLKGLRDVYRLLILGEIIDP